MLIDPAKLPPPKPAGPDLYHLDDTLRSLIEAQVGPMGERIWPMGAYQDAARFGYHETLTVVCMGPCKERPEFEWPKAWHARIVFDREDIMAAMDRHRAAVLLERAFREVMREARLRHFGLPVFRIGKKRPHPLMAVLDPPERFGVRELLKPVDTPYTMPPAVRFDAT